MSIIDPTKIFAAAQKEAKNAKSAHERFRSYLLEENERLRDEINALSNVRVQNERLSVRTEMAIVGDSLLTIGSIGFGILGAYGAGFLPAHWHFGLIGLCFGAAAIGLGLKLYQWWRR